MNYKIVDDMVKLVKYELRCPLNLNPIRIPLEIDYNEEISKDKKDNEEIETNPYNQNYDEESYRIEVAFSEKEKDELLERFPDATVTEVDNSECEWLDGYNLPSHSQDVASLIDKAVELGQELFEKYLIDTDINAQMLDTMYRVTLLEVGVTEDDLSAD